MKKNIAIALAVLLALAPATAVEAAAAEDVSAAGVYRLKSIESEDSAASEEDLALVEALGMTVYARLDEDGTFLLSLYGEEMEGSWDETGVTIEGETVPYTLDGDTLIIESDGEAMIFARSSQEEIDAIMNADPDLSTLIEASSALEDSGGSEDSDAFASTLDPEVTYAEGEQVLFENESARMTVTGYETDEYGRFVVKALCENLSDANLMFSVMDAAVNGYMFDPFWSTEVAAGKSANEEMVFDKDEIAELGLTAFDNITMELRVSDADDWMADPVYDDKLELYPTGKTAEEIVAPERRSTEEEQVLVDNENFAFVVLGSEEDEIWGYTLQVFIENRTQQKLMVSWDNVSVNGFMVDPYWATELLPGKRTYAEISFPTSEFEANGIEDVSDITFTMTAYDSEDWTAENLYDATLTYTPGNNA